MKRLLLPLILGTLLFNGTACADDHLWSQSLPDYSQGYDETRDPARDLAAATAKASAEGKKVLLLVGGEWCSWCQEMNRFLDRDPISPASSTAPSWWSGERQRAEQE
jgi:thioredoxin-related protein